MTQNEEMPDFDFGTAQAPSGETAKVERFMEKPLPSSIDSERLVLGAVLLDNDLMQSIAETLAEEDFYSPTHRIIYRAMLALLLQNQTIDPILIIKEIKKAGTSIVGEMHTVTMLTFGIPRFTEQSVIEHVSEVRKTAVARRLFKLCNRITVEILAGETDIEEIASDAEATILATVNELHSQSGAEPIGLYSLKEIVPEMQAQFENYSKNITSGISTGMQEIDDKLDGGGLQDGGLYLIAGGEKTGKTSIALDWVYSASAVQKHQSLVVTAEMSKVSMAKRIYSSHTGISYNKFRPGLNAAEYKKILEGLDGFGNIPVAIGDRLRTVGQITKHFQRWIDQSRKPGRRPVRLGVIDYLQLIELDGAMNANKRVDVVSAISRGFKLLASQLGIPIIVMSSLNRMGLESGGRPDTINLRDSGTIGFDAEAVFFVHNPAYVPGKPYVPQEITDIDLILARQRNGPTGDFKMKFIGPFMQFMTERQYNQWMSKGQNEGHIPPSSGQVRQEQEDISALWKE